MISDVEPESDGEAGSSDGGRPRGLKRARIARDAERQVRVRTDVSADTVVVTEEEREWLCAACQLDIHPRAW